MNVVSKHPIIATAAFYIFCITILDAIALVKGINGMAMTASVGSIAGIGGYMVRLLQQYSSRGDNPESSDE